MMCANKDLTLALEAALAGWKTGTGIIQMVVITEPDENVRHACYLAIVRQKYPDFEGDIDEAAIRLDEMCKGALSTKVLGFIVKAIEAAGNIVTKDGYRLYKP